MNGSDGTRRRYFILSFLLSFTILSLFFYALAKLARPELARAPEPVAAVETTSYVPSREEALTVLFVGLDSRGGEAGVFLLARFDPAGGRVPIVVLPCETAVMNNGKPEALAEIYRYGGADYARERLSETLGIGVDRYVRMDVGAFVAAADAVGVVEFMLPQPLSTEEEGVPRTLSAGLQLLDGAGAAAIIRSADSEEGEEARCALIAELAAAIVNQRMDVVLSDVMDNVFQTIVNLVDTDISYADYDDRKRAAAFLARLGQDPARPLTPEGSHSEDGALYTLADTFVALLTQSFV